MSKISVRLGVLGLATVAALVPAASAQAEPQPYKLYNYYYSSSACLDAGEWGEQTGRIGWDWGCWQRDQSPQWGLWYR